MKFNMGVSDQSIEVFASMNRDDGHCNLLGLIIKDDFDFVSLMESVIQNLRQFGVRYLEIIIKAHRTKLVDSVLQARCNVAARGAID